MNVMKSNGKENDLRIDLKNILWVEMPDYTFGFEIPPSQAYYNDDDWKRKYPNAHAIYRIYGISPYSYVTKHKI